MKSADTAEARAQLEAEAAMNNEGSKELSHAEIMVKFLTEVRPLYSCRASIPASRQSYPRSDLKYPVFEDIFNIFTIHQIFSDFYEISSF